MAQAPGLLLGTVEIHLDAGETLLVLPLLLESILGPLTESGDLFLEVIHLAGILRAFWGGVVSPQVRNICLLVELLDGPLVVLVLLFVSADEQLESLVERIALVFDLLLALCVQRTARA